MSVTESSKDLNKRQSWLLALESMEGLVVPVLALAWSASGRAVERVAVRLTRVLESVVPAWPRGIATNSTPFQCFLSAATRG